MKIIEALKLVKDLYRKADDLKAMIGKYCADVDYETPVYADQKAQVSSWMQAHGDVVKLINLLQYRIQKTNIQTLVTIELEGKQVTKSIAEWILRRKKLCDLETNCWKALTDRNLKEGHIPTSTGHQAVKIRRYYEPTLRDQKLASLTQEPSLIDGRLEIINATTDLLD